MRFLSLSSGVHLNTDSVEAVFVGEPLAGEWPVVVRTAGNEYVDLQAKSEAAAREAVALIVADLTGTKHVKVGTTAPCVNCGTALGFTGLDGIGWVHVLAHSAPERKGCIRPVPVSEADEFDAELAGILGEHPPLDGLPMRPESDGGCTACEGS